MRLRLTVWSSPPSPPPAQGALPLRPGTGGDVPAADRGRARLREARLPPRAALAPRVAGAALQGAHVLRAGARPLPRLPRGAEPRRVQRRVREQAVARGVPRAQRGPRGADERLQHHEAQLREAPAGVRAAGDGRGAAAGFRAHAERAQVRGPGKGPCQAVPASCFVWWGGALRRTPRGGRTG